jgi:hypothetical protein
MIRGLDDELLFYSEKADYLKQGQSENSKFS